MPRQRELITARDVRRILRAVSARATSERCTWEWVRPGGRWDRFERELRAKEAARVAPAERVEGE
jgi:hypothetical protein